MQMIHVTMEDVIHHGHIQSLLRENTCTVLNSLIVEGRRLLQYSQLAVNSSLYTC